MLTIDGLSERIERIVKVDIDDFSEKYKDFLSIEQLAREFFVSTGTITSWIKAKKIIPDAVFPFGTKKIFMFSPQNMENIRKKLNIPEHNEKTLHKDFFDFLEQRDYTLSYKMPFLLSLLKNANSIGEAKIDYVLKDYIQCYKDRLNLNLPVDKKSCPYASEFLKNEKLCKENMITNPFEKFERKRFMFISKDLGIIAINSALWDSFSKNDILKIKTQLLEDLRNYYKNLGNIIEENQLVNFAKGYIYATKVVQKEPELLVADSTNLNSGEN